MRRDKKLGEAIIVALCNHKDPHLTFAEIRDGVSPNNEYADDAIQYHIDLLEDVRLVTTDSTGLTRLTSAGQDRAENTDKPDSMDTWRILGS
jgi:repressor of nif and glnA expression